LTDAGGGSNPVAGRILSQHAIPTLAKRICDLLARTESKSMA